MSKSKMMLFAAIMILTVAIAAGCTGTGTKPASDASTPKATSPSNTEASSVEVPIAKALTLWQDKKAVVIDVRTPAEYQEGHIPGVANIPLDQLEARIGEIPKDKQVLLICRSGKRSGQGTALLRSKNMSNVYNITEGMNGWQGPVAK
jgi:hydroxyacylglutathione hydrolase